MSVPMATLKESSPSWAVAKGLEDLEGEGAVELSPL